MNFNLLLSEDFNKFAANVTVSGLVIVFAMLILLVLIIIAFGKIMALSKNNNDESKAKVTTTSTAIAQPATSVDDDEIIAVISAAVATLYSGTGKTAVVRSIKPAKTAGRSAWSMAGLNQNVRSF